RADIALLFRKGFIIVGEERLRPHPIENKPEYKVSLEVYNKLAPNTSYIRRQAISRISASSILFQQSKEFNTTRSELTTIEGDGLRVNLFVSKCQFRCVNCFNELSQKEGYGEPFTDKHEAELLETLSLPFVDGITLVGGVTLQKDNNLTRIDYGDKEERADKTICMPT